MFIGKKWVWFLKRWYWFKEGIASSLILNVKLRLFIHFQKYRLTYENSAQKLQQSLITNVKQIVLKTESQNWIKLINFTKWPQICLYVRFWLLTFEIEKESNIWYIIKQRIQSTIMTNFSAFPNCSAFEIQVCKL
jgi:hypothetical protein